MVSNCFKIFHGINGFYEDSAKIYTKSMLKTQDPGRKWGINNGNAQQLESLARLYKMQ